MKKVLVTGGAGFVGSHLVDKLLELGYQVTVIDDLSTGRLENLEKPIKNNPNLKVVPQISILDRWVLDGLVFQSDYVFHLAAVVGVKEVLRNPINAIHTNIEGTRLVLEAAKKYNKMVVIASSSEVYGPEAELPYKETSNILTGINMRARWSYACSKAMDEYLALSYYKQYGVKVNIVRLFNVVGPRQRWEYGMVLPNFVINALLLKPLIVHNGGNQTRSFCHVKDIVTGMLRIMFYEDWKGSAEYGQIFNLGREREVTIKGLAEIVLYVTQSLSSIINVSSNDVYDFEFEDMPRRRPDISKARKILNFEPSYTMVEMVESVVNYYKEELRKNNDN